MFSFFKITWEQDLQYIIPEEIHVHKDGFLIGNLPDKGTNVLRRKNNFSLKKATVDSNVEHKPEQTEFVFSKKLP